MEFVIVSLVRFLALDRGRAAVQGPAGRVGRAWRRAGRGEAATRRAERRVIVASTAAAPAVVERAAAKAARESLAAWMAARAAAAKRQATWAAEARAEAGGLGINRPPSARLADLLSDDILVGGCYVVGDGDESLPRRREQDVLCTPEESLLAYAERLLDPKGDHSPRHGTAELLRQLEAATDAAERLMPRGLPRGDGLRAMCARAWLTLARIGRGAGEQDLLGGERAEAEGEAIDAGVYSPRDGEDEDNMVFAPTLGAEDENDEQRAQLLDGQFEARERTERDYLGEERALLAALLGSSPASRRRRAFVGPLTKAERAAWATAHAEWRAAATAGAVSFGSRAAVTRWALENALVWNDGLLVEELERCSAAAALHMERGANARWDNGEALLRGIDAVDAACRLAAELKHTPSGPAAARHARRLLAWLKGQYGRVQGEVIAAARRRGGDRVEEGERIPRRRRDGVRYCGRDRALAAGADYLLSAPFTAAAVVFRKEVLDRWARVDTKGVRPLCPPTIAPLLGAVADPFRRVGNGRPRERRPVVNPAPQGERPVEGFRPSAATLAARHREERLQARRNAGFVVDPGALARMTAAQLRAMLAPCACASLNKAQLLDLVESLPRPRIDPPRNSAWYAHTTRWVGLAVARANEEETGRRMESWIAAREEARRKR